MLRFDVSCANRLDREGQDTILTDLLAHLELSVEVAMESTEFLGSVNAGEEGLLNL